MQTTIKRRGQNTHANSSASADASDILALVYANRGVHDNSELDYALSNLLPPSMKGIRAAAALLADHIEAQNHILFVGDFDADGATSTALGLLVLREMGVQNLDFLVPNRFEYGYGLTPEIVEVAKDMLPDLIVTVDNGISSIEGVAAANAAGIQVLVTDHHLPGAELPAAAAIVNPNQLGCDFESKALAGVGVLFYLLLVLRKTLTERGWFKAQGIAPPKLANYLDIVALGTVADVVPLDYNNRILVHQGLGRITKGRARPGIRALLEVAKREPARIVASDLGFAVGPRLNAAGRLDDMSLGIQCLLTDDLNTARQIAQELDDLNKERRDIESGMQREAMRSLEKLQINDAEALPWGICLFDETWHQGVVGIVASRIKDKFHRPTIAFAEAGDGDIKGSARSINGLHMRDALDLVAKRAPSILSRFGGHAMAAGLSLKREHFDEFSALFDSVLKELMSADQLDAVILSDAELAFEQLALPQAQSLRAAGPWGQGFPEPLFDGTFQIVTQRVLAEKHLKLLVADPNNPQKVVDAIAFNIDPRQWPNPEAEKIRLAYRLDVNEYRGKSTPQLMVQHIELVEH